MIFKGAYWISPIGDLLEVGTSHIAEVIKDPEKFGWTFKNIQEIYRKFGERIGIEGKARTEILIQIIQQGWIRLRKYREYWSITVYSFSDETKGRIKNWAAKINFDDFFIPVKINELATNQEHKLIFSDLLF